MNNPPKLGTLNPVPGFRDAVHVAIVAVYSDEDLDPGLPVILIDENKVRSVRGAEYEGLPVGVVDPFLKETIHAGTFFWLCLYPQTVTDMSHVWKHPLFDSTVEISKRWLMQKAERVQVSYNELIETAQNGCCFGNDLAGESHIEPEFWLHLKTVTGTSPLEKPEFFRCAC